MTAQSPLFRAPESAPQRSQHRRDDADFEEMVNADLRDFHFTGPQVAVLRREENRVRWLQVLTDIRTSILSQNAHDNALLKAHPDRPEAGRNAKRSYLQAKREVEERKQSRERVLRGVNERIGEARRLIGVERVPLRTVGLMVHELVEVDSMLRDGSVEQARNRLASVMRLLTDPTEDTTETGGAR